MDIVYQRNKIIIITAFVTMAFTSMVWLGIGGLGYWLMYRDKPEFELTVECPEMVEIGEVFKIRVGVKNGGMGDLKLSSIDIYEDLLDGFEILSVSPKPRTTEKIIGYMSYEFSQNLAPSQIFDFEIELRARDVGYWAGDIDACTPTGSLVTYYTEIEVLDPTSVDPDQEK